MKMNSVRYEGWLRMEAAVELAVLLLLFAKMGGAGGGLRVCFYCPI